MTKERFRLLQRANRTWMALTALGCEQRGEPFDATACAKARETYFELMDNKEE